MQLDTLQVELEQIYDIHTPHRVNDYLFHDTRVAGHFLGVDDLSFAPEQLLVRQSETELEVSLYLHQTILDRLAEDDPAESLHAGNLSDYWLVIEGVSHFLHLVWNAGLDRPVSRLELELLAEIDKFVTASNLIHAQTGSSHSDILQRALFEAIRFREGLEPVARERYYEANRLAARYCRALDDQFDMNWDSGDLKRELRRFRRLPRPDKFRHIEAKSIS